MAESSLGKARLALSRLSMDEWSTCVGTCRGVFEESRLDGLESQPTINLFEQWEEGAHLPKLVNARDYSFPKTLVVPFTWMCAPRALSLSEAVNYGSQHAEKDAWGQAPQISLVAGTNYPNQPERNRVPT